MASNSEVSSRYAEAAPDGRMLRPKANNVLVSDDGTTIYSYGRHFPMARIMPAGDDPRGWWLVNGDSYSVSTSRHQSDLRSALARTGLPVLIVPFTAISRAGIRQAAIVPVQIMPDTYETVWHSEPKPDGTYAWDVRTLPDGREQWAARVHHLGASVFTAEYGHDGAAASFLSAFDEQERHALYFLAQLPDGVHPATVAEALTALRLAEVLAADAAGVPVTRQGDVFAIPADVLTRELPAGARQAYVLGVNHVATEVRERDGVTWARGTLRHRPRDSWRQPEHKRQRMGDGRQWHRLIRNTVPDGRSWSAGGRVD